MIDRKVINPFLNSKSQLRSGWWVLIFFLILAAFLFPILFLAQQSSDEVSIGLQVVIIAVASWICQLLRWRPLTDLFWEDSICIGCESLAWVGW